MVDRYTKSVLAIIAAALVAITAQNVAGFAFANVDCKNVCGTPRHPVCEVTWTKPPPVETVPADK
jgi:hypothetical protein